MKEMNDHTETSKFGFLVPNIERVQTQRTIDSCKEIKHDKSEIQPTFTSDYQISTARKMIEKERVEFDSHIPIGVRKSLAKPEPKRNKTMISPALNMHRPTERSSTTMFQPLLRTPAVANENPMEVISRKKI